MRYDGAMTDRDMSQQTLILIFGHNASGKTTLAKKIVEQLDVSRVNGDDIRDFLISKIRYYADAIYSYPSPKIRSANISVNVFRKVIIEELLKQGESVLVDGAGITKERRRNRLIFAEALPEKAQTVIIECVLSETELLDRLRERDKKSAKDKWVDFYKDIRKEQYDRVSTDESDFVFHYDQKNGDEIISDLREILRR